MKKREKNNSNTINQSTPFLITEAYKAARTNLMFMINKQEQKRGVVFTSYLPMDGKSTTCVNMAITFAQTGAKILVIDADMRNPTAHELLQVQAGPGLSDKLGGIVQEELCIYRTSVENLFLMPAGTQPPNPTELLLRRSMDELLDTLSPLFDYIFIDAPPIGLVTDAVVLGSKTDGVIFVVNGETTKKEYVRKMQNDLQLAGDNLIGCILNSFNNANVFSKAKRNPHYKNYYGVN